MLWGANRFCSHTGSMLGGLNRTSYGLGFRTGWASARGERAGGAYCDDDVADCLAGYGCVGFVGEERSVGGVRVPVETVGRQCGHVGFLLILSGILILLGVGARQSGFLVLFTIPEVVWETFIASYCTSKDLRPSSSSRISSLPRKLASA